MSRQEANRKILEKIAILVEREPDWRFHQILQNMGIEDSGRDQWYDESAETLAGIDGTVLGIELGGADREAEKAKQRDFRRPRNSTGQNS